MPFSSARCSVASRWGCTKSTNTSGGCTSAWCRWVSWTLEPCACAESSAVARIGSKERGGLRPPHPLLGEEKVLTIRPVQSVNYQPGWTGLLEEALQLVRAARVTQLAQRLG